MEGTKETVSHREMEQRRVLSWKTRSPFLCFSVWLPLPPYPPFRFPQRPPFPFLAYASVGSTVIARHDRSASPMRQHEREKVKRERDCECAQPTRQHRRQIAAKARQAQPTRKARPPIGVTAPRIVTPLSASA